jgi:Tfp pilus assembly protein PilE
MAKIKQASRGITLIELLVYMGIFSLLFLVISSSVFYMQKIIQSNNQDFYVKNQIYRNLDILQQYLKKCSVVVLSGEVRFLDKNNNVVLTQKLAQNHLVNVYRDKSFDPINGIKIDGYQASIIENGRVLQIVFSYTDARGKSQRLTEYLIVIRRNL